MRYRQTLLGSSWVVLQPLLTMALMTTVFSRLIGVSTDGVPYPLFCLSGLILWTYFTQAINSASSSVLRDTALIEKVYFPRLIIPLSAAVSGLLDLAIGFVVVLVAMALFGYFPSFRILLCLPVAMLVSLLAIGLGAALAALSVRFRDIAYLVPVAIQLGLFATPIAYPASLVPAAWQPVLGLNPMAGFVELFRWALLDTDIDPWPMFGVSCLTTAVLFVLGLLLFRRLERTFADVI